MCGFLLPAEKDLEYEKEKETHRSSASPRSDKRAGGELIYKCLSFARPNVNRPKVTVTMDIQVDISDGIDDDTIRTVKENCKTLKFSESNFE
jgi:hypothetical protein